MKRYLTMGISLILCTVIITACGRSKPIRQDNAVDYTASHQEKRIAVSGDCVAGIADDGSVIVKSTLEGTGERVSDSTYEAMRDIVWDWTQMKSIAEAYSVSFIAAQPKILGLNKAGKVITPSSEDALYGYQNVKSMHCGPGGVLLLFNDGQVLFEREFIREEYVEEIERYMTGVITASVGAQHVVGLKEDGSVVGVGDSGFDKESISKWQNVVAIDAGYQHTVALLSDGRVLATGNNQCGQCETSEWEDIVAIAAGPWHTVGLKADGTCVAVGDNRYGQCDVDKWKNIVEIEAGGFREYTIGLSDVNNVYINGKEEPIMNLMDTEPNTTFITYENGMVEEITVE